LGRRLLDHRVGRLGPDRFGVELGGSNGYRIQRRLAPGHFQGQFGEIHDAPVAAITTLVVGRAHEDAIHWARVHAQSAEHALGIIDLETVDPEALAHWVLDLVNIDTINWTGAGTLVTADAGAQVEAMKTTIARLDGHWQFWILEALRERFPLVRL